jgi:uncharacterized membrane protein
MKLILAFFAEGAVRAWSEHGLSARLALAEAALALVFFSSCVLHVRSAARKVWRGAACSRQAK